MSFEFFTTAILPYANQSFNLQSRANQWTGFYMIGTSVMKDVIFSTDNVAEIQIGDSVTKINSHEKIRCLNWHKLNGLARTTLYVELKKKNSSWIHFSMHSFITVHLFRCYTLAPTKRRLSIYLRFVYD